MLQVDPPSEGFMNHTRFHGLCPWRTLDIPGNFWHRSGTLWLQTCNLWPASVIHGFTSNEAGWIWTGACL